jgi:hypothetical protein
MEEAVQAMIVDQVGEIGEHRNIEAVALIDARRAQFATLTRTKLGG